MNKAGANNLFQDFELGDTGIRSWELIPVDDRGLERRSTDECSKGSEGCAFFLHQFAVGLV